MSSRRHTFRVPTKHGAGHGTIEEWHAAPWRHEEYTKLVHVGQAARAHEGATHSTSILTRSSAPPPYTPRNSKLVFIIKMMDQPLEEEWRKEQEVMLQIWFDFFFSFSLFFSYVQICVCELFLFYFQHVCDSSSFRSPSPWIISTLFFDN
jgi:hypothetical protein